MQSLDDTICALSSARGRAGIAVVRLSGRGSFGILEQIFRPAMKTEGSWPPLRQAMLGKIEDPSRRLELDEAVVTCFPEPHSYTGEDVAEISMHGSPVLVAAVLECLGALGARLAEPGEFTMRRFLRGRIDLTQAEAIQDLIDARTLYQARVAARQRSGEIAQALGPVKKRLIEVIVQLEAAIEFAEEDLPLASRERVAEMLAEIRTEVTRWLASYRRGRILRDGFTLAIVGRPNVGKSSLFNSLLSRQRSIVTAVPGTTRDLVSEYTHLEGIPVRLVDTAGVRGTEDVIEQMGVERSYQAMADADAALLILDRSEPPGSWDLEMRRRMAGLPGIAVFNKSDLAPGWSGAEKAEFLAGWQAVDVSATEGYGMVQLQKAILDHLFGDGALQDEGLLVTNLRHYRCLERSAAAIGRAGEALGHGLSEEYVLVDLKEAMDGFGELTGETTVEDLLGEIFSRFCVGK